MPNREAGCGQVQTRLRPLRTCPYRSRKFGTLAQHIIAMMKADSPGSANQLVERILGLDVGSKRIGIAISDPLGFTAQGLETLQRQNKRVDFEKLSKLVRDYEVAEIVVGFPLRMSGAEGTQAEK